ncbi:origin recognition complex subunit [Culex quinquefasciatus]|uniref:Origin recognition complex subunit n=1 Tax=Culex quinquefasciatus TaxID=7176 RepID=B0W6G2_CULQU|nr:origin recognition complex subunit [Culex quinquefasciatus]|eukprot:XP_001844296.1 origin recognition complex subunit [Culex quinquefasciatus]
MCLWSVNGVLHTHKCVAPGIGRHRVKERRRNEDSPKAILNRLTGHVPCAANGYASLASVDSMKDFVAQLARMSLLRSYIVVLENAERVRDMDHNVLPMLLRLPEVTGLNVTGLAPVVAEYSKKDILVIVMNDFEAVREQLRIEFEYYKHANLSEEEIDKRVSRLEGAAAVALECFHKYCEPVLDGTIAADDVTRLWRNISKTMKLGLGTIYMRMGNVNQELLRLITVDGQTSSESVEQMQTMKQLAQNLELPFYAKFLLIAYSRSQRRQGGQTTVYEISRQAEEAPPVGQRKDQGVGEDAIQLGPKAFTIDRLLAIFYAILDEKIGLTCNLLAQISTLIHLKFLNFASGEGTIMDGSARPQCTVGMDFIVHIGKMVGFNVRQYLCDFF